MLLKSTLGLLLVILAVARSAAGQTAVAPAWGDVISGLRVGLAVSESGAGRSPELEIFFQNASDSGFLINLGVMLGNAFEPRSVALSLTERDSPAEIIRGPVLSSSADVWMPSLWRSGMERLTPCESDRQSSSAERHRISDCISGRVATACRSSSKVAEQRC